MRKFSTFFCRSFNGWLVLEWSWMGLGWRPVCQDDCSGLEDVSCWRDTLRLFANPPTVADPGQTVYTFRWFNPEGDLISTQENFFIPGIDEDSDGAYSVVIRGITGCEATGIVNVAVGEIPAPPTTWRSASPGPSSGWRTAPFSSFAADAWCVGSANSCRQIAPTTRSFAS